MPKGVYKRHGQTHLAATPESEIRSSVLRASREIMAAGERVNQVRLRKHGVRGAHNRVHRIRKDLVAAGELPPETAPATGRLRHPRGESSPRPVVETQVDKDRQLTHIQLLILQHKLRRPQDFRKTRDKLDLDKGCHIVDNLPDRPAQCGSQIESK